jgi:hypothetical protein
MPSSVSTSSVAPPLVSPVGTPGTETYMAVSTGRGPVWEGVAHSVQSPSRRSSASGIASGAPSMPTGSPAGASSTVSWRTSVGLPPPASSAEAWLSAGWTRPSTTT